MSGVGAGQRPGVSPVPRTTHADTSDSSINMGFGFLSPPSPLRRVGIRIITCYMILFFDSAALLG